MFLALSFSMVSIPTEGKELILVSERSLKRERVQIIHLDTTLRLFLYPTAACAVVAK